MSNRTELYFDFQQNADNFPDIYRWKYGPACPKLEKKYADLVLYRLPTSFIRPNGSILSTEGALLAQVYRGDVSGFSKWQNETDSLADQLFIIKNPDELHLRIGARNGIVLSNSTIFALDINDEDGLRVVRPVLEHWQPIILQGINKILPNLTTDLVPKWIPSFTEAYLEQ